MGQTSNLASNRREGEVGIAFKSQIFLWVSRNDLEAHQRLSGGLARFSNENFTMHVIGCSLHGDAQEVLRTAEENLTDEHLRNLSTAQRQEIASFFVRLGKLACQRYREGVIPERFSDSREQP